MKKLNRRLFASLLLGVFLIAGCTTKNPTSTTASSTPGTSSSPISHSQESTPSSTPDVTSTPDVSTPEDSTPVVSTPENSTPVVSTPEDSSPVVSTPDISSPDISTPEPVADPTIYLFGSAVSGNWNDYYAITADEDGFYYDIINLTNALDGFVIAASEVLQDKTKFCYHDEKNANFVVVYSGAYLFGFTFNDMSSDEAWKLAVDSNGIETTPAYYRLEAQFTPPEKENKLYIYGPSADGASWSAAIEMEEISPDLYFIENRFSSTGDGFVVNEMSSLADRTGFCLHENAGGNFHSPANGIYEFYVTFADMSADSAWLAAVDTNAATNLNPREHIYYRFVEVEVDAPVITTPDKLWLYGPAVADLSGNWTVGPTLSRVDEKTYSGLVRLSTSTDGFVIYETSGKTDGYQIKTDANQNINLARLGFATPAAGVYQVTVSWENKALEPNWHLTTTNILGGGTVQEAYLQVIDFNAYHNKTDLAVEGSATVTASTASKAADNVLKTTISDANRWESQQGVDPQWLMIDLGSEHDLSQVIICWYAGATAKTYTLEVSSDGENFTTLEDVSETSTLRHRVDSFDYEEAVTARYIRIYGTSRTGTYGYSIGKVYVF